MDQTVILYLFSTKATNGNFHHVDTATGNYGQDSDNESV